MTKQQLIENVENNPKFEGLTIRNGILDHERIGFLYGSKYYWFRVIDGDVMYMNAYSINSGRVYRKFLSAYNVLKAVGYFE